MERTPGVPAPLTVAVVVPTFNRPDRVRDCLDAPHSADRAARAHRGRRQLARCPHRGGRQGIRGRRLRPQSHGAGSHARVAADRLLAHDRGSRRVPRRRRQRAPRLARAAPATLRRPDGGRRRRERPERDRGRAGIGARVDRAPAARRPAHGQLRGRPRSRRRRGPPLWAPTCPSAGRPSSRSAGSTATTPAPACARRATWPCASRKAGHRLVYTPDAVVDHLPGEYAKGKRFDRRYVYYANRNSVVLLARVYGMDAPIVRRFLGTATREVIGELRRGLRGALSIGSVGPYRAVRTLGAGITRAAAVGGGGRRGRARRGTRHPLGPGPAAGARRLGAGLRAQMGSRLRINAYVLAADPWWLEASISAYYPGDRSPRRVLRRGRDLVDGDAAARRGVPPPHPGDRRRGQVRLPARALLEPRPASARQRHLPARRGARRRLGR